VDSVTWVEGPFHAPSADSTRRILKTHLPITHAVKGDTGRIMPHKVIIVLRDPVDTRLSWFRHVRRIAKKHSHMQPINMKLIDFLSVPIPIPNVNVRDNIDGKEPEYFIASALQHDYPENVLIVFYEEFFRDPVRLVEKIARFTDYMGEEKDVKRAATSDDDELAPLSESETKQQTELVTDIAAAIINDADHPNAQKRNGSSGQGAICFPPKAFELFDNIWESTIVAKKGQPKMQSYQQLYISKTNDRYAFANAAQDNSGLVDRLSNLTTGSNKGTGNSRLKRGDSSSETAESFPKPRKFGSLIKFMGGSRESNADQQPTRPMVVNLPKIVCCTDPDDSDDEARKDDQVLI